MYPKKFWIITGLSLIIASGVLFIPFNTIHQLTGISFLPFLLFVLIVEFICALVVAWQILKHKDDEEARESQWRYHP